MFFLNLSFRHKIPLWGSILILISAVMFSLSFGILAYDYLKQNHINNTISHGQSLINTIYTAFMHDDIWSAFNLINRSDNPPSTNTHSSYPKTYIETLVIFNSEQRVFASNKPENYPILANVEQLDFISPRTKQQIKENINTSPIIMQEESKRTIIILPIIANDNVLGHLLMINNETLYRSHFYILIFKAVLTTTIFVLCILLPINWYWGQRMAKPLVYLTEQISVLHKHLPDTIATHHYHYNDELGQLFKSYALMVDALKEKAFLEKQILQSERMAAIGRLSAELAHEINNPLAGMLMAIDTLKQHGSLDALSEKTISLLARGLNQIKESVAAILVEAKVQSHDLSPQDIEDVHQLVIKKANLTMIKIVFTNQLKQAIKLPSTPLRQVMLNLLLNALQATGENGFVEFFVASKNAFLNIVIKNTGTPIPEDKMAYLFEPYNHLSISGHGLGLWITYQIVHQLKGQIHVQSDDQTTLFKVTIPYSAT